MPTLTLTDDPVAELVEQLPAERKRSVLLALAAGAASRREARMQQAERRMRQLAEERNIDWDALSEDERENLVDDLIHEDRGCA